MLALKLLRRYWRSGELKLLSFSLMMAVCVVSAIAVFTERLESTLTRESVSIIGADLIVRSSQPIRDELYQHVISKKASAVRSTEFSSVVFAGDDMHLASIKAVEPGYPLRGALEVTRSPYSDDPSSVYEVNTIPAPDEVWVDARLFALLNLSLGDVIAIGEHNFTVTNVLVKEPENRNLLTSGARALINYADVDKTNVIQPGSVIQYDLLVAQDEPGSLNTLTEDLQTHIVPPHERLVDLERTQERVGRNLTASKRFLLLAAVISVLLSGVAIAIAARQFATTHTDNVALMKSFGVSRGRIRGLYFSQLLLVGVIASLIGLMGGWLLQQLIASSIQFVYDVPLLASSLTPYGLSLLCGLIFLVGFAFPAIWPLAAVSPLKVLRRELTPKPVNTGIQIFCALLTVFLLTALFAKEWALMKSIFVALFWVLSVGLLVAYVALSICQKLMGRLGGSWRIAVANIQRQRSHSVIQIFVFSIALMLLLSITIIRTSLIDEWKMQVPTDAPNHFLVNIPADSVHLVTERLAAVGVVAPSMYSMLRARLTHINDESIKERKQRDHNVLHRELNITSSTTLVKDNRIVEGDWWDAWKKNEGAGVGVSVEQEVATVLGLSLGDTLRFSVGGITLDAQIASIRSVNWQSLTPNFYFIFEPASLESFSATFITSVYIPPEERRFIPELVREFPSIFVIDLERILSQVRDMVAQVSNAIMLVMFLILIGGALVLFAAVVNSMVARQQQAGLLRALGASRSLVVGAITKEFAILGGIAGVIAILGTEVLLFSIQRFILGVPVQPHYLYWAIAPVLGSGLLALLGLISCRHVVTTSPLEVLRDAT